MIKYNYDKFFEHYSYKIGKLTVNSWKGLMRVLTYLSNSERLNTPAEHAYVLATIKWETADTYEPITEYGSIKYLKGKPYYPYIGRGYIMLTWKDNFIAFGNALGIDLVNYPARANQPDTAWKILEMGMTDVYNPQTREWKIDPNFTSHILNEFINKDKVDFKNARKVINPGDKDSYEPIAFMAEKFHWIIEHNFLDNPGVISRPLG